MSAVIHQAVYPLPPVKEREALRYAGCREAQADVLNLLQECVAETAHLTTGRVCWQILPVSLRDDTCDFGTFRVTSAHLAKNLSGCDEAVLFAATVGVEWDRLIARYSHLSPAKAVMMQAVGAERIEALCDTFVAAQAAGAPRRPRFSPGYGDLPLTLQREIVSLLDCPRRVGVTLNDSLLLSPSKSVTAFVGCPK